MRRIFSALLLLPLSTAPLGAASLSEVIRVCGDDGKRLCAGVGYGKPMQTCLASKREKLTPACRALVDRLEKGEKVTIF